MVRLSRLLLLAGMLCLPWLRVRVASGLSVSDALFALAALSLALSLHPPPRAPRTPVWIFGSFLFVLAGTLASLRAVSPMASLVVVGNAVFVLFVWQWTARQVLDTTRRTQAAMGAFVLGTGISAAVAIVQTRLHVLGYQGAVAGAEGARALGLAQQPDIAAVTYALGLVFALGLALQLGPGRWGYRVVCIGLIAVALIFSASVSGMACALIGVVVLLARRGIRIKTLLVACVVVVGLYVVGSTLQGHSSGENLNPFARIAQTTGQGTGYNTINPRIATMKAAWSGILDSPFVGHGLDQRSTFVYFDPDLLIEYPTHNFVLLLGYEGGILLLVGAVIAMGAATRRMIGVYRDPTSDILLAGAAVVLVFAMQAPELVDRWLWLPFVLAMTLRLARHATPAATGDGGASAAVSNGSVTGNGRGAGLPQLSGR